MTTIVEQRIVNNMIEIMTFEEWQEWYFGWEPIR